MFKSLKTIGIIMALVIGFFTLQAIYSDTPLNDFPLKGEMIKGVNFVAPPKPIQQKEMNSIVDINANWVAIIPYAFCRPNQPRVFFEHQHHWGEKKEGVIGTVKYAKNLGLKVMIKPHIWVAGQGWPGDYTLSDEEEWKIWEEGYEKYLMTYVEIADSLEVDMICIGTEHRTCAKNRPQYWKQLIKKIRGKFEGKLTYAANWDNIENISFWSELDYIGVDAYFPLSKSKTPEVEELKKEWEPYLTQLKHLNQQHQTPVIFTEYGYRSIDHATQGHWELKEEEPQPNMKAQQYAYQALYEVIENQPWYHGGFLWKWFAHHNRAGGLDDHKFTPQNKPVMEVIKEWHLK